MLRPGFEPESSARKAEMIGRTTPPEQIQKFDTFYNILLSLYKHYYYRTIYNYNIIYKNFYFYNLKTLSVFIIYKNIYL